MLFALLARLALLVAARSHQLVAVIYIDLDNFKPINDTAGHAVGDEVLREVAHRLRSVTRSADICARIGGDEFAVMCTQLEHPDQVHEVARMLISELTRPISVGGSPYVLGGEHWGQPVTPAWHVTGPTAGICGQREV